MQTQFLLDDIFILCSTGSSSVDKDKETTQAGIILVFLRPLVIKKRLQH